MIPTTVIKWHRCDNKTMRPYPSLLCSLCRTPKDEKHHYVLFEDYEKLVDAKIVESGGVIIDCDYTTIREWLYTQSEDAVADKILELYTRLQNIEESYKRLLMTYLILVHGFSTEDAETEVRRRMKDFKEGEHLDGASSNL